MSVVLNRDQAKRFARWLHDNHYTEVAIIEPYPMGAIYVKARNRCGMTRVVSSLEDFDAVQSETL
jgi:hypothetical protein